ncbi:MAG: caspase family protein [Phycisphaerae bacterium]|nr:caspase family protein [Saprospiraceae bacterium]
MRQLLILFLMVAFLTIGRSQSYKLLVKPSNYIDIPSMDISPDGSQLAVIWGGNTVDLWNLQEGEKAKTWSIQPQQQIGVITFSPDGAYLAAITGYVGRRKSSLIILDISEKNPPIQLLVDSLSILPRSLIFSADGRFLIACSMGSNNVTAWNLQSNSKQTLPIQRSGLNDCRCTILDDHTLRIADTDRAYDYNYESGELIAMYPNLHLKMIGTTNSVSISKNGQYHACSQAINSYASGDKTTWITITDITSGKIIKKIPSNSGPHPVLAFSQDGALIALGDEKGKITIWNIADEKLLFTAQNSDTSDIWSLKFSPTQKMLVSLGSDRVIKVWTPEKTEPLLSMYSSGKSFSAISASGQYNANTTGLPFIGYKTGTNYVPMKGFDAKHSKTLINLSNHELTFSDLAKHPDAPVVAWIEPPGAKTSMPSLSLKARITSKYLLTEVRIFLNNLKLPNVSVIKDNILSVSVPLKEGRNEIFAEVTNQYGVSKTVVLKVDYTPDRNINFYAILFAVDDYKEGKLLNSLSSADSLQTILSKTYGFQTEVFNNPTASEMMIALRKYRKKIYGPNDHLLVYFSGHGYLSKQDSIGYILLKGGQINKEDEADTTQISHSILGEELLGSNCNHTLIILDACYSSYFGDAMLKTRPSWNPTSQLNKEEFIQSLMLYRPGYFYLTAGLGVVTTGTSSEGISPFTKLIIDNLKKKDFQTDEIVLLGEINSGVLKARINPLPRSGFFGNRHNLDANFIFLVKK